MNDFGPPASGNQGLHFGHLGLIMLCAGILIFTAWMKSGFNFVLRPDSQIQEKYTYAQARAEALAEANGGQTSSDIALADTGSQVAMLDPLSNAAQVLGASTGTADSVLPKVADILTPEVLNSIQIKLSNATGTEAIQQYKRDVSAVESSDSAEIILSDVDNTDPKVLLEGSKMVEPLVRDLSQVAVPQELVEYHKIKMFYYLELSELADGYAGVQGVADPKDMGMNIFSLTDRLQRISSDIQTKYGVQL